MQCWQQTYVGQPLEIVYLSIIMKYDSPNNQSEILPNLLGLQSMEEIDMSEFEGFLKAEILLSEKLNARTKFNIPYLLKIHKFSLGHLYSFAGKYRDVNISKGGFAFPASHFLPETMNTFENEILSKIPNNYNKKEDLIKDIAKVHAELLFIHPFREGNGRTARILANLMSRKQGFDSLKFELITEKEFPNYVVAVQASADKNYEKMEKMIAFIFPD